MDCGRGLGKKTISAVLILIFIFGMLPNVETKAKNNIPEIPKIKVEEVNKGRAIKITVAKTKNADGYEVYYSGHGDMYDGYRADYDEAINVTNAPSGYGLIARIEKSGTKKRSITVKPMVSGKLNFKVCAFSRNKDGSLNYGKCSKEKTINVKNVDTGYKNHMIFQN